MIDASTGRCPCGGDQPYQLCCQIIHDDPRKARSPEALMRARYTAYTQANMRFIEATMLAPANSNFDANDALQWAQAVVWKGLQVLESKRLPNSPKGVVEFVAWYQQEGQTHHMHERSLFIKKKGQWFYKDAKPTRCQVPDLPAE